MTVVITGATGNLGALTVDAILRRGIGPDAVVAGGRNADRLAALAARGVRTAVIDFDDPPTLRAAFDGVQKVLLVSVPGNSGRVEQHRNAIDAAEVAGVEFLAYTSWVHAGLSSMLVAADHRATEQVLRDSRIPHAVLRCAGYFESRTALLPLWRKSGEIIGAAGNGRFSAASRADLADAAAAVLTTPGHEGAVYELASEEPFTMSELAVELGRRTGETMPYVDLPVEEFRARLVNAGFSERLAAGLADHDRAIAAGELVITTGDLRRLVGRPVTELPDAIGRALSASDSQR